MDIEHEIVNLISSIKNPTQSQNGYDEIEDEVRNLENLLHNDVKNLDTLYNSLIDSFFDLKQNQLCLIYIDKLIELHKNSEINEDKAKAYHNKGIFYHVDGNLMEAESYYKKAYNLSLNSKDLTLKDNLVYSLGNLYQHYLANFNESFKYYKLGAQLAEKRAMPSRQAFFIEHCAMALYWQEKFSEALNLNEKAKIIISKLEREDLILYIAVLEASILIKMDKYKEAFQALLEVCDLKEKNTDAFTHTDYLLLLSDICREIPDLFNQNSHNLKFIIKERNSEVRLIDLALKYATNVNHPESMGRAGFYKGKLLWNKGKHEEATEVLQETLNLVKLHNRGQVILAIERFSQEKRIQI